MSYKRSHCPLLADPDQSTRKKGKKCNTKPPIEMLGGDRAPAPLTFGSNADGVPLYSGQNWQHPRLQQPSPRPLIGGPSSSSFCYPFNPNTWATNVTYGWQPPTLSSHSDTKTIAPDGKGGRDDDISGTVELLFKRNEQLQHEMAALQRHNREQKDKLKSLTSGQSDAISKYQGLLQQYQNLKNAASDNQLTVEQDRRKAAEMKLECFSKEMAMKTNQISALSAELTKCQEAHRFANSEIDRLQGENEELAQTKSLLTAEKEELRKRKDEMNIKYKQLKHRVCKESSKSAKSRKRNKGETIEAWLNEVVQDNCGDLTPSPEPPTTNELQATTMTPDEMSSYSGRKPPSTQQQQTQTSDCGDISNGDRAPSRLSLKGDAESPDDMVEHTARAVDDLRAENERLRIELTNQIVNGQMAIEKVNGRCSTLQARATAVNSLALQTVTYLQNCESQSRQPFKKRRSSFVVPLLLDERFAVGARNTIGFTSSNGTVPFT